MKGSNAVIGIINFLTFLISIPILAGGIWLSNKANTDCLRFLQWPLIVIGVALMVLSLAGFAGACYRLSWLLWLYLFAMFFVIAALVGFIIFAFAVTDKGEGEPVLNRGYLEYHLPDYSGWLRDRVADPGYWAKISSCLRDAKACRNMARYDVPAGGVPGLTVPESADMFYQRKLSPIEVDHQTSLSPLPVRLIQLHAPWLMLLLLTCKPCMLSLTLGSAVIIARLL